MDVAALGVLVAQIKARWPHGDVYRDDQGNLWIENDLAWVARLDLGTGTLEVLEGR